MSVTAWTKPSALSAHHLDRKAVGFRISDFRRICSIIVIAPGRAAPAINCSHRSDRRAASPAVKPPTASRRPGPGRPRSDPVPTASPSRVGDREHFLGAELKSNSSAREHVGFGDRSRRMVAMPHSSQSFGDLSRSGCLRAHARSSAGRDGALVDHPDICSPTPRSGSRRGT
jgi:hypothetical protein